MQMLRFAVGRGGQGRDSHFQKQKKSVLHTDGTGMTRSHLFPLSFLLWEAKAPKTRLLVLKIALLFYALP